MTSEALKRDYVEAYIRQNPGCSPKDLQGSFTGTKATLAEHVRILEKEGRVHREGVGKAGCYFPATEFWTAEARNLYSVTKAERTRAVTGYLSINSPASQVDIMTQLDLEKRIAHFHLAKLQDIDMVSRSQGYFRINSATYTFYCDILSETKESYAKYVVERRGVMKAAAPEGQKENVFAEIVRTPGITMKEIADTLHIAETTVLRHYQQLAKERAVKRFRRGTSYSLFASEHLAEEEQFVAETLPKHAREIYVQAPQFTRDLHSLMRRTTEKLSIQAT